MKKITLIMRNGVVLGFAENETEAKKKILMKYYYEASDSNWFYNAFVKDMLIDHFWRFYNVGDYYSFKEITDNIF